MRDGLMARILASILLRTRGAGRCYEHMGLAFWCFTYQAIFSQPWRPSQPALKADAPTDADIPSNFLRKVTPTTVEGLNSRASHGNHPVDWRKQGLCNGIR